MEEKDKRTIPRNVDGRLKVGLIPIRDFIKILPLIVLGIINVATNLNPVNMFLTFLIIAVVASLFCEFRNKETGLQILKEIMKYQIEGTQTFERSCKNVQDTEKIIKNRIKTKKRSSF